MTQAESEARLLVALGHPLRREILRTMAGKTKISPRDAARLLGEPISNVSYHFRVLHESDAVDLVDIVPVRGSAQHFYRLAVTEPWVLDVLGIVGHDGDDSG